MTRELLPAERLIGKTVTHFAFGKGRVTQARDGYIVVGFRGVERMFEYPAAFGEYLTVADKKLQKLLPVCRKAPAAEPAVKKTGKDRPRHGVQDEYDTVMLADTVRCELRLSY